MRISMIGAGYVGLVSGACFAEFGVDVTVMDVDPAKISALHEGRMPIYEPGLDKLVAENVAAGRLGFTTDLKAAIAGADAVFLAVGTPTRRGDKVTPDITPAITRIQNLLTHRLATRVQLHHGEKKGSIQIEYYGSDDLNRILALLGVVKE